MLSCKISSFILSEAVHVQTGACGLCRCGLKKIALGNLERVTHAFSHKCFRSLFFFSSFFPPLSLKMFQNNVFILNFQPDIIVANLFFSTSATLTFFRLIESPQTWGDFVQTVEIPGGRLIGKRLPLCSGAIFTGHSNALISDLLTVILFYWEVTKERPSWSGGEWSRIINCSIIGTQKTHLEHWLFNDSVPGREPSFLPLFIRECFQIKLVHHAVMHIITAGGHRLTPISQLVSVCDMNPSSPTEANT